MLIFVLFALYSVEWDMCESGYLEVDVDHI